MPRLTEFSPIWIDFEGRKGLGVMFKCTTGHCDFYNAALFANPIDGGLAFDGDSWALLDKLAAHRLISMDGKLGLARLIRGCGTYRWQRDPNTSTFENLTLTPSLNMHECGHFVLTNGGW